MDCMLVNLVIDVIICPLQYYKYCTIMRSAVVAIKNYVLSSPI